MSVLKITPNASRILEIQRSGNTRNHDVQGNQKSHQAPLLLPPPLASLAAIEASKNPPSSGTARLQRNARFTLPNLKASELRFQIPSASATAHGSNRYPSLDPLSQQLRQSLLDALSASTPATRSTKQITKYLSRSGAVTNTSKFARDRVKKSGVSWTTRLVEHDAAKKELARQTRGMKSDAEKLVLVKAYQEKWHPFIFELVAHVRSVAASSKRHLPPAAVSIVGAVK